MLRTASDGADVVVEEGGNEWEVLNPHGTAKGQHDDWAPLRMAELRRRWVWYVMALTSDIRCRTGWRILMFAFHLRKWPGIAKS
jgi:hypothetical protein